MYGIWGRRSCGAPAWCLTLFLWVCLGRSVRGDTARGTRRCAGAMHRETFTNRYFPPEVTLSRDAAASTPVAHPRLLAQLKQCLSLLAGGAEVRCNGTHHQNQGWPGPHWWGAPVLTPSHSRGSYVVVALMLDPRCRGIHSCTFRGWQVPTITRKTTTCTLRMRCRPDGVLTCPDASWGRLGGELAETIWERSQNA